MDARALDRGEDATAGIAGWGIDQLQLAIGPNGRAMISAGSFLRRLPTGMLPKDRISLESLAFASDLAAVALSRLQVTALGMSIENPIAETHFERSALFSDAWGIVDAIHASRSLLAAVTKSRLGPPRHDLWAFETSYESATLMRNKMDHLAAGIDNLVSRKGTLDPFFGAIRFVRPHPDAFDQGIADGKIMADVWSVISGSSAGEIGAMLITPDTRISLPVSNLELRAFGHVLDLDLAVQDLIALLERMASTLEEGFDLALDLANLDPETKLAWKAPMTVSLNLKAVVGFHVRTGR